MRAQIRIYGHGKGNGSWSRVTDGLRYGLRAHGFAVATHYIDADDEQELGDEPIAIYVGAPAAWPRLVEFGEHRERWVVLAPNSTWMPPRLMEALPKYATRVLAPSQWAANVLRQHTKVPVYVVAHGVNAESLPMLRSDVSWLDAKINRLEQGLEPFRVLHFTSSDRARKGTAQLIEAWERFAVEPRKGLELVIVADHHQPYTSARAECPVRVVSRLDLSLYEFSEYVQDYHCVCQPSRAEGFGLCPLEALSAGIPVIATTCTGHGEYLTGGEPWAGCAVPHAPFLASLDDGPGALAPFFDTDDLVCALWNVLSRWRRLAQQAFWDARTFVAIWDWPTVLFRYGLDDEVRKVLRGW